MASSILTKDSSDSFFYGALEATRLRIPEPTMNDTTTYKLHPDSYLSVDKSTGEVKIIMLTDDNFYFKANLVAAEIVQAIDGKHTVEQVLEKIAAAYDEAHQPEILQRGQELFVRLAQEGLIVKAS